MFSWLRRIWGRKSGKGHPVSRGLAAPTTRTTLELQFVYTGPGFPSDPPKRLEYLQVLLDKMKDVAPRMAPGVPEDWGRIVEARHQMEPPGVQLRLTINPSCEDVLRQIYAKEWEKLCAFLRNRASS